jgi:hypothetical protein
VSFCEQLKDKMNDNPLPSLAELLAKFNAVDVLAAVGALQLMPENADRSVRLEVLAHVAASIGPNSNVDQILSDVLNTICNSWPLADSEVASAEDPFESLFTEAFTFFDGSYVVFPGITEEATYILKHLSMGIFRHPQGFSNYRFKKDAAALIHGVLLLSNEIAKRAGLDRGVPPVSAPGEPVVVPSGDLLNQLKAAVTFKPSELARLLTNEGLPPSSLNSLVMRPPGVDIEQYSLGDTSKLIAKPIVLVGNMYVAAIPGALLAACTHELIRLAIKNKALPLLAQRYNQAVWETVNSSLFHLGNSPIPPPPPECAEAPLYSDGFFNLDRDKLLYALLITDPLDDYDECETFGHWPSKDLQEKIAKRLKQIEEFVFSYTNTANEMLHLVLVQGVGRSFGMGFTETTAPFLNLTAASLDTIAWLEVRDPLLLWNYALASSRVRNHAMIMTTSDLDEFHLYRIRGYSYYLSDEARPNFISVSPGGAGALRTEVLLKRDWHGVASLTPGATVEVTTIHDTRNIPVYASPDLLNRNLIELLVEGLPLPVWVANRSFETAAHEALFSNYMQFADAIAYWLWQFSPALRTLLVDGTRGYSRILVEIGLLDPETWEIRKEIQDDSPPSIEVSASVRLGTLTVNFRPTMFNLLEGPDNRGERYMMQEVLRGLGELLLDTEKLSDHLIQTIIDTYAPISDKKMIMTLDIRARPDLDPRDLPRFRPKQKANVEEMLDELGEYLITANALPIGPIADTERTHIVNDVIVPFCFEKFKRLVASLNPHGLLEWLVRQNESGLREIASHGLTIPTRIACFGAVSEVVERIREELPELSATAMASRFVLEYIVAQPPTGVRPISLSVYDDLIALTVEMIDFGFESDLIHFNLADIKLAILPSGRLGTDRTSYSSAHDLFRSNAAREEISRATRSFKRHWGQTSSASKKADLLDQIDVAASEEFGHSLTELLNFLAEGMNIGKDISPTDAALPVSELISRLEDRLVWPSAKVENALDLLSLKPRADFLKPPAPHRLEDVLPWRFNRSLSYLRRPFLLRLTDQGSEMVWGNRALYSAWAYLINLFMEGRLRAHSLKLRQVLGEVNEINGEEFNDRVADALETHKELTVRRRVKKFGHLKLVSKQGDLGDLDVIAVDAAKKIVWVIECKSLAVGRTPFEMSNEITNLFRGKKGKASIIERHQKRVDWVSRKLGHVLAWFDLDQLGEWKVEARVVVDRELFTPYLTHSPMPVVAFHELNKAIESI